MTFEEFVPAWNRWFEDRHGPTAFLVGIRADESLNRFRTLRQQRGKRRFRFEDLPWSTRVASASYAFYPLYDWGVEDIWTYIGRERLEYNRIYDRMYLAGMGLHEMRICEPYSREARKHLDKYHRLEPETWDKIVQRAGGVNFGAQHGASALFAYRHIEKPPHLTWKEYAGLLLETLPGPLQDHYRRRIDVFRQWFRDQLDWEDLKEESDLDLEMRNQGGSWRMVCRTLLRNDYFCTHLCFSVNKNELRKFQLLKDKYADL
jgi:predicted phosphoadenosine phosphosulfate sulfurtransferase